MIGHPVLPIENLIAENGSAIREAKCRAISCCASDSTLMAKAPDFLMIGCERLVLLTITRTLGGSAVTLHTAVAVMPFRSGPSADVMTLTFAAKRRMTALN